MIRRSARLCTFLGGIVLVALVTGACGSAGTATATASLSPKDREKALLAFAKCMREHGVDVADPTVDANGNPRLQRPRGAGTTPPGDPSQRAATSAARTACQSNLKGVFQQFTATDRATMQDNLLKYAQCMRAHGVNVPDPNLSATPGPGSRPFGDLDRSDPKVAAASTTCQKQVFGTQGGPGGFGFGPGGGGPR